jgi:mannose-1-phosphate guanylyltransferase
MNSNYFCVIMAGGAGTRFWPISRATYPKQFIDILGIGKSLLQLTFQRFSQIVPVNQIYIVTSEEYRELTLAQLPEIKENQVLLEPARRNTAPCIAYANFRIQKISPDAQIIVAPSDHLILDEINFIETIKNGLNFISKNDCLLTLGIEPSRPDTGYGYIQFNKEEKDEHIENICKVKTFTEKPDIELAKFFVQSGEFYWNSGIFIWSVKNIQNAFIHFLPEMFNLFNEKAELFDTPDESIAIKQIYPICQNISIDYGIMEKASNVYVLGCTFGWSDLGTWTSLFENMAKNEDNNVIQGDDVLLYRTSNTIISCPKDKLVVVQGLVDYIVVDTADALLICNKKEEQQIRLIVNDIKTQKGDKYI